jgi:DNA-binding CsgD family transcriptional regulator
MESLETPQRSLNRPHEHITAEPLREDAPFTHALLLMQVLDEVDYGLVLVTPSGVLRYANHLGMSELLCQGPLNLSNGRLQASHKVDQAALTAALDDAQRGCRRLISLGHHAATISVASVPMPAGPDDEADCLVLLLFGKRRAAETLTLDFYARSQGLTATEASVLKAICGGTQPKQIAREQGVAISTVRSHICNIRLKTNTKSIRDLMNRVSVLPPITLAMKSAAQRGSAPPTAVH